MLGVLVNGFFLFCLETNLKWSQDQFTGYIQGSHTFRRVISRPWNSWKMTVVMEKSWNFTSRSWYFLNRRIVILGVCLSVTVVCLFVIWMYCSELIKFDVFNTSYYVEVETGALMRDIARSWKMILGGHGKVLENFYGRSVGTVYIVMSCCSWPSGLYPIMLF